MTEQETMTTLIETAERAKSNSHRIDGLEMELKEVQNDQKVIYKLATSVEVMVQRMSHIEEKVDDTNRKVDAQTKALNETEKRFTERLNEVKEEPMKQTKDNVNAVKIAVIVSVCSLIVSGLISLLLHQ